MTFWKAAFFILPALLLVGCSGNSGSQAKSGTVKGKVMLDGAPLPVGKIVFDEGPSVPTAEMEIKDGMYSGSATVGKKTVRIHAIKYGPAPAGMAGQPGYEKGIPENYLPAKYNTASTDTREVKEGANSFDFEVKTK